MAVVKLPPIDTHDGRRAWAFLAICGGAMSFSLLIWICLYLLRDSAGFLFWLAMAAHVQVLVGMTAIGWAMGRRAFIHATRDGVTLDDRSQAAHRVADAAEDEAREIERESA